MLLTEREIRISKFNNQVGLFEHISEEISKRLAPNETPVRFVVTRSDDRSLECELGLLSDVGESPVPYSDSIFDFERRRFENTEDFNAVLLIPTGIGAEIGGHSGDGGPVARLLATTCDTLITHPNVVNAADINELPENALYVEGSIISRFMMGTINLQKVRSNRVMLVIDEHHDRFFNEAAINSASAARVTLGIDCPLVIKMHDNILMRSLYSSSGRAVGRIECLEKLLQLLNDYRSQYDAVALSSIIEVPSHFHKDYFSDDTKDMVNPWGGVEAMLTHAVSTLLDVPSAHSPMMNSRELLDLDVGVVDPRKAAEAVSTTFLHCILKGLHKSPRIIKDSSSRRHAGLLTVADVSCLVIPDGCIGLPTLAALEQNIPVIAVKENRNRMENDLGKLPFTAGKLTVVDNYLEAVGVMTSIRAGLAPEAVRRPIKRTKVCDGLVSNAVSELENAANSTDLRNII